MILACSHQLRSGMATLWAMAVLSIIGVFSLAILNYLASDLKMVRQAEYQKQAQLLARSGLELAIERLLSSPAEYKGETATLLEKSTVEVKVAPVTGEKDQIQVRVQARYPTDSKEAVAATLERRLRRIAEGGLVKVTILPAIPPPIIKPQPGK